MKTSRRNFLKLGSLAVAGSMVAPLHSKGDSPEIPAYAPSGNARPFSGLHPAGAAGGAESSPGIFTQEGIPFSMMDPSLDQPDKEWCYMYKPTVVVGVPFVPAPVQVTYDGSVFTGHAELGFYYGTAMKPIMARQRTFLGGWIPVVQYDWEEEGLRYSLAILATSVDGLGGARNTLQLVKFSAANNSDSPLNAFLYAGAKGCGSDHRLGKVKIEPATVFRMTGRELYRDEHLIYRFPAAAERMSVPGKDYLQPFKASDHAITPDAVCGIVKYGKRLAAGESFSIELAIPRVPVPATDEKALRAIREAAFEPAKKQVAAYWKDLVEKDAVLHIPEKRVNDSYKAGLVHLILATRDEQDERGKRQGSGLLYDGLFLIDFVDMRSAYDTAGLTEMVQPNIAWLLGKQNEEGMFLDDILSHGAEILTSHGQALYSLAHHYIMTRDKEYAARVLPGIKKAVAWMQRVTAADAFGLLPPSTAYDAEMIKGHYTSHNLWGLLGLRTSIRFVRDLGAHELAGDWEKFHDEYKKAVLHALSASLTEYYVPPGLYNYLKGGEARQGFKIYNTDQDWENNLLAYPSEVLSPGDPRVQGTVDSIRRKKYREGIMTYRNGMHLHQYVTLNQATQYLVANQQKQALLDLYHVLLHNGSCHEGFENLVEPWGDRDPWPAPGPHAWAAAKTSLFIRNCLVCEWGGEAGLQEDQRGLLLFSLISPAWVISGRKLEIRKAPTEFGKISAVCHFREGGADISIQTEFHHMPAFIALAVPYHKELIACKADTGGVTYRDGRLWCPPALKQLSLTWGDNALAREHNFRQLLEGYRSEREIAWEAATVKGAERKDATDKMNQGGYMVMMPNQTPFLLPDEEEQAPEALCFDTVRRAFQQEYKRRYERFTKQPRG